MHYDKHWEEKKNLDSTLKKQQRRRIKGKVITDLNFADDITLISEEIDQAQRILSRVESAEAVVGLIANSKKTKVME